MPTANSVKHLKQCICVSKIMDTYKANELLMSPEAPDILLLGGLVLAVLLDFISSGFIYWLCRNEISSLTFQLLTFPSKPDRTSEVSA